MDEGDRYFEAYPKDARVLKSKIDLSKVLNTYPDRRQPYYNQANKRGLEAFLDIVDPLKVQNTVNPQFDNITKRYVERIRRAAENEIKNIPGSPGFGDQFWNTTKLSKATEINEALKGVSNQLQQAGFDAIRFADDSHPTIAVMKSPESYINLLKSKAGRLWSTIAPVVKPVAAGLGAAGALMSPSADAAIADIAIPGGLESLGSADESAIIDKKYQQYIKKMQNRRKYPKTGGK